MYQTDNRQQLSFNPVDYGFSWTADWYKWDRPVAVKAARRERDAKAKELRAKGWRVRCWTLSDQLITSGGIGSGHPQIEAVVSVYMLNATR